MAGLSMKAVTGATLMGITNEKLSLLALHTSMCLTARWNCRVITTFTDGWQIHPPTSMNGQILRG
jgi:hypothetical protein